MDVSSGAVEVDVLGTLQVRVDGRAVDLGPRRHREVLATLVADVGRPVSVDALLARVWGESAASTSTLHAIISRLRGRLGDGVIATDAAGYRLALEPGAVDAVRFADLVARARATDDAASARQHLTAALALWRGPAYDDVRTLAAEAEAARLDATRTAAQELAAELDLELGRHADVVEQLPALVEQHPLRESLRASLMLALYRTGRQVEALELYEQARDALADELGLDPGPSLQRLHERILRQDPDLQAPLPAQVPAPAAADGAGARPSASPDHAAMVGRAEQLAELRAGLHVPAPGPASVTTVTGEAGIGKTRLLEEAVRTVGAEALVVWGRCWDHDGAPAYWPWEQALTALADALPPEEVAAALAGRAAAAALLLPGHADSRLVADGPEVARARLYDGVVAFLTAASAHRSVVVVLEDMHWADEESVELTEHVAAATRAARLALVVSVRDPSDALAADDVVAVLARAPRLRRIALSGLDVAEVGELVAQRIGAPVEENVAAALRERTEGNPFYLDELARLFDEERRASGRADVPVPTGVRAVIERRLRRLPADDREVLDSASVIGRTFAVGLLAELLRRPRFDVAESLDRAVRAGLLTPDLTGGEQRFSHALVQETIAASLGPQRRAALHARVAAVLETYGGEDEARTAALAHHYAEAGATGDPVRAVAWLLRAAQHAEQRLALRDAERTTRLALDTVPMAPPEARPALELDVLVRLGSLVTLRLGYNAAEVSELRRRALVLAEEIGAAEHLLSALWGTWGVAVVSGDYATALTACDRLARAADATGDPLLAIAASTALGQTRWYEGRLAEARAALEDAVRRADAQGDAVPLDLFLQHPGVQARGVLAVVLALSGDEAGSDRVALESLALAEQLAHPYTRTFAEILEGLRLLWLERPVGAADRAARGLDLAREHGFEQLEGFALIPAGASAARLGDPAAGEAMLRRAIDASLPTGQMFAHLMVGLLAESRLLAGHADDALEVVEHALTLSDQTGERFHLVHLHLLRSRIQAQRGHDTAADLAAARAAAREQGVPLDVLG
ncbi:BTAD domain-containing putative transcriptional regulator [Nocardioides sp. SYSU D00065]|uniref:ATP-binding protein n=1 Tax=Nocardioides sp. SYSU D00065 TaxID=2817378 RepID=UPI001B33CE6E|nr:BTAD domain-containing putative transcriptional regulator [Nocardioides sp. SYSU D00065]